MADDTDLLNYRDRYPDAPGYRDTDTSREAAASMETHAQRLQGLVLAAIREAGENGLTTNEAAEMLDIDKGSVQPRTSELKLRGEIVDSGQRRRNDSGRRAIVWVAA
jgi:DNA-directed RNA polymerase specialized sigma24 family protein